MAAVAQDWSHVLHALSSGVSSAVPASPSATCPYMVQQQQVLNKVMFAAASQKVPSAGQLSALCSSSGMLDAVASIAYDQLEVKTTPLPWAPPDLKALFIFTLSTI